MLLLPPPPPPPLLLLLLLLLLLAAAAFARSSRMVEATDGDVLANSENSDGTAGSELDRA